MLDLQLAGRENVSHILIGNGLLKDAAALCAERFRGKLPSRVLLVTDENVYRLYGEDVRLRLFSLFGDGVILHVIPAGE